MNYAFLFAALLAALIAVPAGGSDLAVTVGVGPIYEIRKEVWALTYQQAPCGVTGAPGVRTGPIHGGPGHPVNLSPDPVTGTCRGSGGVDLRQASYAAANAALLTDNNTMGELSASAITEGVHTSALTESYSLETIELEPITGSGDSGVTFSVDTTYTLTVSGAGRFAVPPFTTGPVTEGWARASMFINEFRFSDAVEKKTDGVQSGVLSSPNIRFNRCPCVFTLGRSVLAHARSGASANAQDPVRINLPPGWRYKRGSQMAPTPLRFVSMTPCRLVETRSEYNFEGRTLPFGPPSLRAAETRTFSPSASTLCNVPLSARAFVFNVTVVPRATGLDYITLYPAGYNRPNVWTVRSPDGLIVANSAIVHAGDDGQVSLYTPDATDVIVDIAGYFTDDAALSNLAYYPITPCRVIETRPAYRPGGGPFGPPSLAAGQTRTFRLPQSTDCPIPSGAAAYSATVTVVPPTSLPYLTAWPAGTQRPNVSTINSPNARVLANSVILPASADGSINLFALTGTDVIVDINGYFAPDNGQGLWYYARRPCRVMDTTDTRRTGVFGGPIFPNESSRTIPIPSSPECLGIPTTAKAYALHATVMPNGNPMPYLTVWPSGQSRPNASVINAFEGQTVTSGFIVPAGAGGAVDVYAYRQTNVVLDISGYFAR